jgi:hypothetical protein
MASPTRALPKGSNSIHIAMAANKGPSLSERTDDLPTSYTTMIVRFGLYLADARRLLNPLVLA